MAPPPMAEPVPSPLPSPETQGEARLLAASRAGTLAELAGLPPAQRVVRASLVRALLEGDNADGRRTEAGVQLANARLAGPLVLDGLSAEGGIAPPLLLRHAQPAAGAGVPVLARGLAIAALDLAHSRLARLEARGLDCPALDLTGVAIATPDGRVDLEGAHLTGAATLTGLGPADDRESFPLLNLAGARLAGPLPLAGARLRELLLIGAVIGGDLELDGASLHASGEEPALLANAARIAGGVRLVGASVQGQLRLLGATVQGALLIGGSRLANPGAVALLADGARLGALSLSGSNVQGELRALGASIAGAVTLDAGMRLSQPGGDALTLDQAAIGGGLRLAGARLEGTLRLRQTRLEGLLELTEGCILAASQGAALLASEARLGRGLWAGHATLRGPLDLTAAQVSGAVILESCHLAAGPAGLTALEASRLSTTQGLRLRDTDATGQLRFDQARIGDALTLLDVALSPAPAAAGAAEIADPAVLLSLRGTQVADALRLRALAVPEAGVADLRGAQAGVLEDAGGTAWGRAMLRLVGFTYAQLAEPPLGQRTARQARLDFLLRQFPRRRPSGASYSGAAFTQVAQTLRAHGHGADADFFARARRRFRRKAGVAERPLGTWADAVVGLCFGDFYSARRTLATLALWLCLGAGGLWAANLAGVLREGSSPAACWSAQPGLMLPVLDRHVPLPPLAVGLDGVRMAAGLTLPGLPLGWEARCQLAAEVPAGWVWARRLYQGLGALLLLLSAASLTGLFRRD